MKKWKDPPHFALANWQFDTPENVCKFIKRYGAPADLLRGNGPFIVSMSDMRNLQEALRAGWRAIPFTASYSLEALKALEPTIPAQFNPWGPGGQINVDDPWNYACLIFRNDFEKGLAAVCPNRDCLSPYFIKTRGDQQFCSQECRNLVNVQRWRSVPKNQKRERAARKKREGKT